MPPAAIEALTLGVANCLRELPDDVFDMLIAVARPEAFERHGVAP
jgi:hypothetical protein